MIVKCDSAQLSLLSIFANFQCFFKFFPIFVFFTLNLISYIVSIKFLYKYHFSTSFRFSSVMKKEEDTT